MFKLAATLAFCAIALPAHADQLRDTGEHDLPTHQLQFHDSLDVVEDSAHGIICYVARQSDSHAMQMQCLKVKP